MDKDKKNIQQINIELDEKISSGEYANFVVVTHSTAEFVLDFDDQLPRILADESQMRQLVMNLVTNAQEAMSAGRELTIVAHSVDDITCVLCKAVVHRVR